MILVTNCVWCVFFFFPFVLDVRLVDVPAGVTQEEGHTGFLIRLPSAVLALIFLARRIQPFLSLVDGEFDFFGYYRISSNRSLLLIACSFFYSFFVRRNPSSCVRTGIRTPVPMSEGFEVTN